MISNDVVCATSKGSDQPVHTHSLIRAFASRFKYCKIVKLLTLHHLECLSLKGCCSSESTLVKMHIVGNHMSRFILNICLLLISMIDMICSEKNFDLENARDTDYVHGDKGSDRPKT